MAIAFIGMLCSGIIMANFMAGDPLRWTIYGLHKASGITLLILAVFRLLWRTIHKPPQLPSTIPHLDRVAAHLGHWFLYFLMFSLPLSGWIMSSAGGHVISMFKLFNWPFFPGALGDKVLGRFFHEAHETLGYTAIVIISVHILALAKHKFFDNTSVLYRMHIKRKDNPK